MNLPTIIFRADAGSDSGMGHFMRCLAMAQMLCDEYTCSFALIDPSDLMKHSLSENGIAILEIRKDSETFDTLSDAIKKFEEQKVIVVLDGYGFIPSYQKTLKDLGASVVYIDDLVKPGQVADVIINPSDAVTSNSYLQSENSRIYCGHEYAPLRKSFMQAQEFKRGSLKEIRSVFVCFGAVDPLNAATGVIRCLKLLSSVPQIHFVTSKINRHLSGIEHENKNDPHMIIHTDMEEADLCRLIKECDIAICAPSTVSQECAAIGIPMLCLLSAGNQKGIYDTLVTNGLCLGLGDSSSITEKELSKNILAAWSDHVKLNELVARQKKWFDGKAPGRIKQIVKSL